MTELEKYNNIMKHFQDEDNDSMKDYDPYLSHTFSHWIRDLEELDNYPNK